MGLKLISHVNKDNDLIDAWLRYYCKLGVDSFHLIVHGSREDNHRLFSIKESYPVVIEDTYEGTFHIEEKKRRLDALLKRHVDQWLMLADSDEFVEFPYQDAATTIGALCATNARSMAAPMVQRLTRDGSLDTPSKIDDPFETFPLCSVDLYRRMGVKADIFKFPLFYCTSSVTLAEGGNHHPPNGAEESAPGMRGATHHFKFRRAVSERLSNRIESTHTWRLESVQFQEYLGQHSNRLPLDGAFTYSREELFRRGLLRQLREERSSPIVVQSPPAGKHVEKAFEPSADSHVTENSTGGSEPLAQSREKLMFVLPKATEFGGLEKHLLELLDSLARRQCSFTIVCTESDLISARLPPKLLNRVTVRCENVPESVADWRRLIREIRPDVLVFCYNWIEAFSWRGPLAGLLSGVRRRFAIQHLIPPPFPPPRPGKSPVNLLRRLIGQRARRLAQLRLAGHLFTKTICVSQAVEQALVRSYGYRAAKTISIPNGVSTLAFAPCSDRAKQVRAPLDIEPDEFVLICVARLVEVKGVETLIYTAARVIHQGLPLKCIVVGDGPLREKLQRLVKRLGLNGYVSFVGFQEDVRPYLQAASAFILMSELEGLPLSILEAMACELPCIVTDVGGNAEAVEDRKVGFVIPRGSIDDAEAAILFLATHPKERDEMGIQARQRVCRSFSLETSMAKLTEVLLSAD